MYTSKAGKKETRNNIEERLQSSTMFETLFTDPAILPNTGERNRKTHYHASH